jgi:hypothetical protein
MYQQILAYCTSTIVHSNTRLSPTPFLPFLLLLEFQPAVAGRLPFIGPDPKVQAPSKVILNGQRNAAKGRVSTPAQSCEAWIPWLFFSTFIADEEVFLL